MTTLPAAASARPSGPPSSSQIKSKKMELKTEDFIKMMITQLQNQDPMEPAKNQELLAQMSQIGQLQSATTLQESLKGMVLQNQIGSASSLIGKTVQVVVGEHLLRQIKRPVVLRLHSRVGFGRRVTCHECTGQECEVSAH